MIEWGKRNNKFYGRIPTHLDEKSGQPCTHRERPQPSWAYKLWSKFNHIHEKSWNPDHNSFPQIGMPCFLQTILDFAQKANYARGKKYGNCSYWIKSQAGGRSDFEFILKILKILILGNFSLRNILPIPFFPGKNLFMNLFIFLYIFSR